MRFGKRLQCVILSYIGRLGKLISRWITVTDTLSAMTQHENKRAVNTCEIAYFRSGDANSDQRSAQTDHTLQL